MWPFGRPRRELPVVNYNEDSESEEDFEDGLQFNSPLVSPRRPVVSREQSPQPLAHPTLNDNVDEVLEEVTYHLHDIQQVEEEIDELTDLLQDTDTKVTQNKKSQNSSDEAEEIFELNLKVASENNEVDADNNEVDANTTADESIATMANFDTEDKEDGDKATDLARSIKVEFDAADVVFWFSQLEGEMEMAGIGKQWLKKSVLQRNLPVRQKEDVKGLLSLQKADAGEHIYLDIKKELVRIYAPKPSDAYNKALTRTMTGLPSQLGYQIVNDVCKKPTKLEACCCAGAVEAIWSNKLPINIRAHISNMAFTKETYKNVFEAADGVYNSSKSISVAATTVQANLDETLPAFNQQNQPTQVAAIRGANRGGGRRGGRGGRNRGGSGTQRGGGQGGQRGGNSGQKPRGPRHASSPPESCCERHYVHGADAWYCLEPLSCPWKDRCKARN